MNEFRRFIASLLILCVGLPLPVQAGMVATDSAIRTVHHERIAGVLERADVRSQLEARGVNPADVQARIGALTDEEVAELAAKIDNLPAGGIGIVGAILIVFLVLLLTDIMGLTKIFPFTRSAR
ncbi:MAG TPA: PA2779 family protein [Burkholderiales bacterium]|jgi:hypothetical protein|nr:PA2779 family protein [Burkholderiales bacterium]